MAGKSGWSICPQRGCGRKVLRCTMSVHGDVEPPQNLPLDDWQPVRSKWRLEIAPGARVYLMSLTHVFCPRGHLSSHHTVDPRNNRALPVPLRLPTPRAR
jgi:hypothetical protein